MINAEHKNALLAFVLVVGVAVMIMANSLRAQAVEVLIEVRAPRPMISALAPDMVLGRTFDRDESRSTAGPESAAEPGSTREVAFSLTSSATPVQPLAARVSHPRPAAAVAAKPKPAKAQVAKAHAAAGGARPATASPARSSAASKVNKASKHAAGSVGSATQSHGKLVRAPRQWLDSDIGQSARTSKPKLNRPHGTAGKKAGQSRGHSVTKKASASRVKGKSGR